MQLADGSLFTGLGQQERNDGSQGGNVTSFTLFALVLEGQKTEEALAENTHR